jgi:tetratricopeptide (TPR) repeat protein
MQEKKKAAILKNEGRSSISTPSRSTKDYVEESRPAAIGRTSAPESTTGISAQEQLSTFEAAMKLFHARRLQEAQELFARAAAGPERDVAHRALLHEAMCHRRLEQSAPALNSAEDHYNYGIALVNTRSLPQAREHFEKALELAPNSDHIHYALALAQAFSGDVGSAFENLRRAIDLEPRNRILARQDADFAPLANQPPFDSLLYPEKKGW